MAFPQVSGKLAVEGELNGNNSMALSPVNYFDSFDDEEVFHRFKLSRPCINFITDYVSIRMKESQTQIKRHSAGGMVMAALDYYANGVVSTTVQDKAGLHFSETHEIISIISKVISGMMNDFVTFPETRDARANVTNEMKSFCGIPNVLGVVACLQVKVRPASEDQGVFRNTLEYLSAMTQVICDCEGNFMSVEDCRVGSTPEQSIWSSSAIGEQFMLGAHGSNWIIGGNGYSLSSHLLTAVSPVSSEPERRFNAAHAKGLRAMQETLTSLKRRFGCLTDLGYCQQGGMEKKADVINACCILHNIAKKFPSLLDVGVQLEPRHPGVLCQAPPGEVPYQAVKARVELIAAHFSVPSTDLNPQNVHQLSLPETPQIKEEQELWTSEWGADVHQLSLPEAPQMKEEQELWTSQGGELLQGLQSDTTDSICTSPRVKTDCDPEDLSQLLPLDHTPIVENRERDYVPANTTENQIKADPEKDYGSPESASDSKPHLVTPDCPTAHSLEEEREGLLPDVKPMKPRRTQAKCSKPTLSSCSSPDTCLMTKTSPSPCTRPIPSSHSCSESDNVSTEEAESKTVDKCYTAEKPYQCDVCHKMFSEKITLVKHRRIHKGKKPYQCEECDRNFHQMATLVIHNRIHTGERPYQCEECGQDFNQKSSLVKHRTTHTEQKSFQCQECGDNFNGQSYLNIHRKIHAAEKPYRCEECDAAFRQMTDLVVHRRIHTGERPQCDESGEAFSANSTFVEHRTIHTGEKPYQCQECDKAFKLKTSFMNHRKIHTGEKPYQCQECDLAFRCKSFLASHSRIHNGEKPYQCEQCDIAFSAKKALKKHRRIHTGERHRRIHSGEKPYQCQECDKAFKYKTSFMNHRKIHTGEKPYQCQECDLAFRCKSVLANHSKIHKKPYQCEQCDIAFSAKNALKKHRRIHKGEKYQCQDCDDTFIREGCLRRHSKIHNGEKPYQCEQCDMAFSANSLLVKHGRIHKREKYQCQKFDFLDFSE